MDISGLWCQCQVDSMLLRVFITHELVRTLLAFVPRRHPPHAGLSTLRILVDVDTSGDGQITLAILHTNRDATITSKVFRFPTSHPGIHHYAVAVPQIPHH